MVRFIPRFGLGQGIFNSIFVAISSFCNAGFDNFGTNSMMDLQTDWLVNLVLAGLVITGGLGFLAWFDLATKLRKPGEKLKLHFHTKVVLSLTTGILVLGTLASLATEYSNPATIGNLAFTDKVLINFF